MFTLAHTLGVILICDNMYASRLVIMALAIFFFPLNLPAALATDSTNLKILVPLKLGFEEFVSWKSSEIPVTSNSVVNFSGFAINVFQECVEKLNYRINYTLIGYGDGLVDPTYNDLVQKLVSKEVDGVVADLTITSDRLKLVDFTQPYIESSLQMIVPLQSRSNTPFWIFVTPFSRNLWATIGALFCFTIILISIVEYCSQDHEHNGYWSAFKKSFWLTSMAIFFSHKDDAKTHIGRALTLFWLVTVLVFTSSYTASLSSILIAQQQQQRPTIRSFADLQKSHLKIGCQEGSFEVNYLNNNLFISSERLVNLITQEDYDNALTSGNVSAIIDESPYLATFLTNLGCKYTIADSNIGYFGGFGFAFQKNSSLTDDMSLAILSLQQNGDLQRIKDKWLGSGVCITSSTDPVKMSLRSYASLFYVIGGLYLACLSCLLSRYLRFRWNRALHQGL